MSFMDEIKRVVVPVDFSDNSKLIAESAGYLTGKFGASMHLVFVVQNFEDYSGFFVPQMTMPTLEGELAESAEVKMVSFRDEMVKFCEDPGVKELNYKVFMGDVGEKIVEFAPRAFNSDLPIMRTSGDTFATATLLGPWACATVE